MRYSKATKRSEADSVHGWGECPKKEKEAKHSAKTVKARSFMEKSAKQVLGTFHNIMYTKLDTLLIAIVF